MWTAGTPITAWLDVLANLEPLPGNWNDTELQLLLFDQISLALSPVNWFYIMNEIIQKTVAHYDPSNNII